MRLKKPRALESRVPLHSPREWPVKWFHVRRCLIWVVLKGPQTPWLQTTGEKMSLAGKGGLQMSSRKTNSLGEALSWSPRKDRIELTTPHCQQVHKYRIQPPKFLKRERGNVDGGLDRASQQGLSLPRGDNVWGHLWLSQLKVLLASCGSGPGLMLNPSRCPGCPKLHSGGGTLGTLAKHRVPHPVPLHVFPSHTKTAPRKGVPFYTQRSSESSEDRRLDIPRCPKAGT